MKIICIYRADSRYAPSQWETVLLCNDVSHWLGANLESALYLSYGMCSLCWCVTILSELVPELIHCRLLMLCWIIIRKVLRHSHLGYLTESVQDNSHWYMFGNSTSKTSTISPREQWVKPINNAISFLINSTTKQLYLQVHYHKIILLTTEHLYFEAHNCKIVPLPWWYILSDPLWWTLGPLTGLSM